MEGNNELKKVYQIHLLLNQAMYLFEDLSDNNNFLVDNLSLYNKCRELSENLSKELETKQNNNYSYTLSKLKKVIENIRIPN